jgi:hypothetical protein
MIVVAWYNGTVVGDTTASGGKPLRVVEADLHIDDSKLRFANNDESDTSVEISYSYEPGKELTTTYRPKLKIVYHSIEKVDKQGITYKVENTAPTGAFVTVGVKPGADYELVENGLTIEYLNKTNNQSMGTVEYNEIAPDENYNRYVFVMPRYPVKISAEAIQKASGLGSLKYKIGTDAYATVPGFESGSHHLLQQVIITSEQGTEENPLWIEAGPPDNLQGGQITIQMYQGSQNVGNAATTDGTVEPVTKVNATVELKNIAEGNTDYTITVLYTKGSGGSSVSTTRNYTLRVMKETAGTTSVKYTYTGTYQIFIPTRAGTYEIEAWGANGGDAPTPSKPTGNGGKGGYVKGRIALNPSGSANQRMPLYIYVGGKGGNHNPSAQYVPGVGGWNGGGRGGNSGSKAGAGGGGATSISLIAGSWNDVDVLGNRILVAGGGGGGSAYGKGSDSSVHSPTIAQFVHGSVGGGLYGSPAVTVLGLKYGPYKAYLQDASEWTFPAGNLIPAQSTPPAGDPTAGFNGQGFGQGGYGRDGDLPNIKAGDGYNGKGGGGGGWWGGRVSTYMGADANATSAGAGGGGGSNYISGHSECRAVSQVMSVLDPTTFEYKLQITSSAASAYFGSANGIPTVGSPAVGNIEFTSTSMNASLTPPDAHYEADPADANLNNAADGNGWLTITYISQ